MIDVKPSDAIEFQFEKNSPTGKFVVAWATTQLAHWRERNDSKVHGEADTAYFPGRIAQIKDILELANGGK